MPDLPHDRCPPIELLSVNQVRWSLNHDHHWYEVATHPHSPFSPGLGLRPLRSNQDVRRFACPLHDLLDRLVTSQHFDLTVGLRLFKPYLLRVLIDGHPPCRPLPNCEFHLALLLATIAAITIATQHICTHTSTTSPHESGQQRW